MPYLLQLRKSGNFTTAALAQLRKLKSPYSPCIYWLLKEYADFGRRTMSVDQLRFVLNIAEHEYPRFSSLKARVLDKAQDELASTDLPFTFELERGSQVVKRIKFLLHLTEGATKKTLATESSSLSDDSLDWINSLQKVGVSKRSITQIARQLETGEYDLGYIDFVLTRIQRQHSLGKVKKLAGAIYKALIEKYLFEEYLENQKQVKPRQNLLPVASIAEPEIAFSMSEVRDIYDNPGPFLQSRRQGETFAQHVEQVYLADGFVVELQAGEEWLVKK
jgi:hypothetical protein